MTLSAGTKLGRYEIRSVVGVGGMGEVYRARDEKLNRDVAIKVLPVSFSQDSDRLLRFEKEAQAAGSLNHPNILAVYDIGTHDRAPYVVSELLEGESLKKRLGDGPIAQRKAIDYAVQIARGLAASHERGIVHRDLKPDNLFITKDDRVKILDFGLAKLIEPADNGNAQTDIATRKVHTDPGTVLGTVGYMSPEQVRGRQVDHRSDIFSFGTVLYEMLAGQRAFHGESAVETLNAILKDEPKELATNNANITSPMERVVWHCLEKSPDRRFQSATDIAFALESLSGASSGSTQTEIRSVPLQRKNRERFIWIAAVAFLLITVLVFWAIGLRRTTAELQAVRFPIVISADSVPFADVETHNLSISPDGRYLAFVATGVDGVSQIWLRPIDVSMGRPLPGTVDAIYPFWSASSRSLGFFSHGQLKRIDIEGGPARSLGSARAGNGGAAAASSKAMVVEPMVIRSPLPSIWVLIWTPLT